MILYKTEDKATLKYNIIYVSIDILHNIFWQAPKETITTNVTSIGFHKISLIQKYFIVKMHTAGRKKFWQHIKDI